MKSWIFTFSINLTWLLAFYYYLCWSVVILFPLVFLSELFMGSRPLSVMMSTVSTLIEDLSSRSKSKEISGMGLFLFALFIYMLFFNVLGLFPYSLSSTSQLFFNMSLALPLWFSIVVMSCSYSPAAFFSHLTPLGAPLGLAPFLVIIETISILARPITLAVRLTANISTGHIIMGLVSGSILSASWGITFLVVFICCMYTMFEFAVCMVQTYIITLLPSLYVDEHP